MKKFKFTDATLKKFDSIFKYKGNLEPGLWVYNNPFKEAINESSNKDVDFFIQVGGGSVLWIDKWSPDGMTFEQIVNKLKQ